MSECDFPSIFKMWICLQSSSECFASLTAYPNNRGQFSAGSSTVLLATFQMSVLVYTGYARGFVAGP